MLNFLFYICAIGLWISGFILGCMLGFISASEICKKR